MPKVNECIRTEKERDMYLLLAGIVDDLNSLKTVVDEIKTAFNSHTHNFDGAAAGVSVTSEAQSNAAVVAIGTALNVSGTVTLSTTK